jgi:hypothetical protein
MLLHDNPRYAAKNNHTPSCLKSTIVLVKTATDTIRIFLSFCCIYVLGPMLGPVCPTYYYLFLSSRCTIKSRAKITLNNTRSPNSNLFIDHRRSLTFTACLQTPNYIQEYKTVKQVATVLQFLGSNPHELPNTFSE